MERPLAGIRVVELAMWVAGPATAAVLADWGADVIKLEEPRSGDPIRGMTTRAQALSDVRVAPGYELDNRNKRSVAADLRTTEGREFALKIIERTDVFVTNLRIDALERMKLDYNSLAHTNPRLIYASLNGYGHRGPERSRPAFDYAAAWARAGLMATVAEPGQPPPAQRPAMIDHPAGLGLAGAISAALFQRERTGRGTQVRVSLFAMGLWMNAADLTTGLLAGRPPVAESRTERINPIWNSYRCKDGKWVYFVMVQGDRHWADFCAAVERGEWLSDSRYRDATARLKNCTALIAEIDQVIASRNFDEWAPRFDRHHLIWAPVQTDAEVLRDPQAHAIGAFVPIAPHEIPDARVVASPVEFGDEPRGAYQAAPELGQHTEEVALEIGLSWDDIARMRAAGAIG
jgi:crotonobetainyl-CoA:carnitine CoA-transferase CaiB-like acyl-CoA transferase